MDPEPSSYLILGLLLLLSAIFSGSETALVSLTPAKLKAMHSRSRGARLIRRIKNHPQKMLTTILLGNNIVNIAATAYATVLADRLFGSSAVTIVTAFMTVLVLIFGEILPKAIANRYSASFAGFSVYLLFVIEIIFYPLIWLLSKFISLVLKIFGETNIQSVTEDELKAMVTIGAEEGALEKHEQELIENVLEFDETEVDAIMTPRVRIDAIDVNKTVADAVALAVETGRTRLPVFKETIDNLVGVVSVKQLLELQSDPEALAKPLKHVKMAAILKTPITRKINSLFNELRSKHVHIAFVYDEHGGLEGLVTMEDILEELVGEILDEFDDDEVEEILVVNPDTVIASGAAHYGDVLDELNCQPEHYESSDQVAWVVLDVLNRYPKQGEEVKLRSDIVCKILKFNPENQVIEKVEVRRV